MRGLPQFIAILAPGLECLFAGPSPEQIKPYRELIQTYCVTCHNNKAKTGGLTLESLDLTNVPSHATLWEQVIGKLESYAMPPAGPPKPADADRRKLISWLETSIDTTAARNPNPGRTVVHRLNRTEYANAIRDLLDIEIDGSALLPPDDSGFGFDNIADVLSVSPMLTERYLSAARKVSRLAVGDPAVLPRRPSRSISSLDRTTAPAKTSLSAREGAWPCTTFFP